MPDHVWSTTLTCAVAQVRSPTPPLEKAPAIRARFQKAVFPEKVSFDGKKFGTTKTSLVIKLNKDNRIKKSHLVTQVGQNWNQLVLELNSWLIFGRDLERARELA